MIKINNKNVLLFCEKAKDINKINILDSDKNYFNDLYYEDTKDIARIIRILQNISFDGLVTYFNVQGYDSIKELAEENILTAEECTDNDYINRFEVNGKSRYTWSY